MAISLTSSGLYLEPRVYVNGGSGNNYGTPRVVSSSGTSLGGGTWSGIYNFIGSGVDMAIKSQSGVSSSSGGGIYFRVS